MKNINLTLNRNQLIELITETAREVSNTIISEQSSKTLEKKQTYIKDRKSGGLPLPKANWEQVYPAAERAYLRDRGIYPRRLFTTKEYNNLSAKTKRLIQYHMYAVNSNDVSTEAILNVATAEGQRLYMFVPAMQLNVHLAEVKICWSRELDKAIDCNTGEVLPNRDIEGFDVMPGSQAIDALFESEVTEPLNTKYFCPNYLMETGKIPYGVRPTVFKWLQQSFSWYDGRDLGLNRTDMKPEIQLVKTLYVSDPQQTQDPSRHAIMSGKAILEVISDYVVDKVTSLEADYNAGIWRMVAGSTSDDEITRVPLDAEQHNKYFDRLKDFARKLKQTNCGFGVGDENIGDVQQQMLDKYTAIMQFAEAVPEDWEELPEEEKKQFVEDYHEERAKIKRQDDIQFVVDMIGLGLTLVGAIILAIPSGGASLAVWGGVMLASGIVIGVGSGIYDYTQGQWVLGTIGISLELIPFAKVFKLTKLLKGVPPKTINEMFAYAMKNGPKALTAKSIDGFSGKLLYDTLKKNKEELIRMLEMNGKQADVFLKNFSSMDATEYFFLMRTSKPWRKAFQEMDFKTFKTGLNELNDIVFANKNYFRSFFSSFAYNFGKPMKILLANIMAAPIILTVDCYEFEFRFKKKIQSITKKVKRLTLNPGNPDNHGALTTQDNIKWVTLTLHPESKHDVGCMLIDIILSRATNGPDQATNDYIEQLLEDSNLQVDEDKITIVRVDPESGEEKEVELIGEEIKDDVTDIADGLLVAIQIVLTQDEDIYATMIYKVGDGDLERGAKELDALIVGSKTSVTKMNELWDLIWWVEEQPVYKEKRTELLNEIAEKRKIYE